MSCGNAQPPTPPGGSQDHPSALGDWGNEVSFADGLKPLWHDSERDLLRKLTCLVFAGFGGGSPVAPPDAGGGYPIYDPATGDHLGFVVPVPLLPPLDAQATR